MAYGSHKQVEVNTGDRILTAASAIPGNEKSINNMVNELYKQGAEVIMTVQPRSMFPAMRARRTSS